MTLSENSGIFAGRNLRFVPPFYTFNYEGDEEGRKGREVEPEESEGA